MQPDPAIDAVRAARKAISARCGHDPRTLVEYYMKRQQALAHRLVVLRLEAADKPRV
jgi:hypothetical protein